jgi:formylglycine-generating enzyme required for sulfatase activity
VELQLEVSDADGLSAFQRMSVEVRQETTRPPEVITSKLPPCFVGQDYRVRLQAEGGSPPLEWGDENLPEGLSLDATSGEIFGRVETAWGSEEPCSQPAAAILRVAVCDDEGRRQVRRIRLMLVDLDRYCEVPAGEFQVGYVPSSERQKELHRRGVAGRLSGRLEHYFEPRSAYLPRFFIKKYPVTNEEWQRFLEQTGGAAVPAHWAEDSFDMEREGQKPVTGISLQDMEAYCRWRGTRLPTGLEWEKAARGTDGRLYPWGEELSPDFCNCPDLHWGQRTAVDQFPAGASPYGVVDMVGNIWECVEHRAEAYGRWRQLLRGGSYEDAGASLLSCAGCPGKKGWPLKLNGKTGDLEPDGQMADERVGFRDVIETVDAPAYPQGLVKVERSAFRLPGSRSGIRTRTAYLARYAVSNLEYLEFVLAAWHSWPEGWNGTGEEPFPFERRFLPVVNVSERDAKAFCRWKGEQLGVRQCVLPPGNVWLAAVHGPGHGREFRPRVYPWGNEYDPLRCNAADSGRGGRVRVFDLPEGRPPCGAFHLVGNVAEWTGGGQVLGGSWRNNCRDPEGWRRCCEGPAVYVGFRYCVFEKPPEEDA